MHQFNVAPDRPSTIRQSNPALTDPKYNGKRVSRRDIEHENSNDDGVREEDVHSPINQSAQQGDTSRRGPASVAAPPVVWMQESTPQGDVTSDLANALRATRDQDRRKGKAVARQTVSGRVPRCSTQIDWCLKALWDSLLDARIRLQTGNTALKGLSASMLFRSQSHRLTVVTFVGSANSRRPADHVGSGFI